MGSHRRRWMPKQPSRRRDERGAEMVEFAFVVVLLIALLYGIISYGLILAAQTTITQAAADGARAASWLHRRWDRSVHRARLGLVP